MSKTVQEIVKLPLGTKVYRVSQGEIHSFILLAFHPRYDHYFYFINSYDVGTTTCYYLKNEYNNQKWTTDYDEAKQIMWEQTKTRINSIREIYFKDKQTDLI